MKLLEINELTKVFGEKFKLGPVSFEVSGGSIAGILGGNGAGKSTLFQLITGNMEPTSGRITILDDVMTISNWQLKRNCGYLPQHPVLPKWVTPLEILRYASSLYGFSDSKQVISSLIEKWDCGSYQSRPLAACSHGMQKRVGLALATMNDPDFLILDEPFSGLDLFHIKALEECIAERKKTGKLTLLSTHMTHWVSRLCDQVYLIDSGTLNHKSNWNELPLSARSDFIENWFFGKDNHL